MTRAQLEHLIRAAAVVTGDDSFLLIGSQSILGAHPDAPVELLRSMEADLAPRTKPDRWDDLDGVLGEGSTFHETFGYYAQGVEESTATLPDGWKARLIPVYGPGTNGATGWALEPHDLAASKYAAGREKDREFLRVAIAHGLLNRETTLERIAGLSSLALERRASLRRMAEADFAGPTLG
jgi:hypothetical protein